MRFILNDNEYLEKYYIVMACDYVIEDYEASILRQFIDIANVDNVYDSRIFQILDESIMN